MRLISRFQNSAGERVRVALRLKGLPFTYTPVSSLAPGEYQRLNPQSLLPALKVEGRIIAQSSAILEYLEERHPDPALLPADPITRAQARAFAALITSEMHAITVQRVRRFLRWDMGADEERVSHWVDHWMGLAFRSLEATLAARERQTPFCFGEGPGWAELHLVPQMSNARRSGVDIGPYPLLRGVEARCVGLDAFRLSRAEAQPDYPGPEAASGG